MGRVLILEIRTLITKGFDLWSPRIISGGMEGFGKGTIQLEKGWQLISIPVRFGWWDSISHSHIHDNITVAKFKNYVLDQIEDLYGSNVVEVANCYTGDAQQFYSYVVGSTPDTSIHNFQLVYDDNNNFEIVGFWINIIGNGPYIISWGET